MKYLSFLLITSSLMSCSSFLINDVNEQQLIDESVVAITDSILQQIPLHSDILVLDFKDLDDAITHFGKYLADRIVIKLSGSDDIRTVDRNNIQLILQEQKLQVSGFVDNKSAVRLGKIVGASHIVLGTIAEFRDFVKLDLKVIDVEKGIVVGGISSSIAKTPAISSLVSTVVKSEIEQQKDLEKIRDVMIAEIEIDRKNRIRAIEEEENRRRNELVVLETEIRQKSIIIADYESRKRELKEKQSYIQKLHTDIDRLNQNVLDKLKIGMTVDQIVYVLGEENLHVDSIQGGCVMVGKYFLLFNGSVLSKVVPAGHKYGYGVIENCTQADIYGTNVARY